MYTKEEEAIHFVIKAFENKKRIKENINLSFHSISVGFMLKGIGCDEETVLSGLLHDIIEDTDYNYEYLLNNYGQVVADDVLSVSEDMSIKDWHQRKVKFIESLSSKSNNVILIELADKLHNLLSDYELWKTKGKEALETLNIRYEDNKWYYLEMKELFNSRLNNNVLLNRYNEICKQYFEN